MEANNLLSGEMRHKIERSLLCEQIVPHSSPIAVCVSMLLSVLCHCLDNILVFEVVRIDVMLTVVRWDVRMTTGRVRDTIVIGRVVCLIGVSFVLAIHPPRVL
jgi:hypothetical protein